MADDLSLNPSRDDFAALLDESLGGRDFMEGQVVHGKVVAIEKDFAIVDVGLKTEGRVLLKEFTAPGEALCHGYAAGARRAPLEAVERPGRGCSL